MSGKALKAPSKSGCIELVDRGSALRGWCTTPSGENSTLILAMSWLFHASSHAWTSSCWYPLHEPRLAPLA
jgi:hypothetical protein